MSHHYIVIRSFLFFLLIIPSISFGSTCPTSLTLYGIGVTGTAEYNTGVWTITGLGAGMYYQSADTMYTGYVSLSGDFDLTATVDVVGCCGSTIGLFARQNTDAGALGISVESQGWGFRGSYRDVVDATATSTNFAEPYCATGFMRIARVGDMFTSYVKCLIGDDWVQVQSASITMTGNVLIGIMAWGDEGGGSFSSVCYEGGAVNTATPTATDTPTYTPTYSPTNTPTYSPTKTPTNSPTNTPTMTPTVTYTPAPTSTPVECNFVFDSFNRANSASLGNAETGQTWVNVLTPWGISQNNASGVSVSANSLAIIDGGIANNITVYATVGSQAGLYQYIPLAYWYLDKDNYERITSDGSNVVATVGAGGTFYFTGSFAANPVAGEVLSVFLAPNGTSSVYYNGVYKISYTNAGYAGFTKMGFGTVYNNQGAIDEFKAVSGFTCAPTSTETTVPNTSTQTETKTATNSPTETFTLTETNSPTRTPTVSATNSPTKTPTLTYTITETFTPVGCGNIITDYFNGNGPVQNYPASETGQWWTIQSGDLLEWGQVVTSPSGSGYALVNIFSVNAYASVAINSVGIRDGLITLHCQRPDIDDDHRLVADLPNDRYICYGHGVPFNYNVQPQAGDVMAIIYDAQITNELQYFINGALIHSDSDPDKETGQFVGFEISGTTTGATGAFIANDLIDCTKTLTGTNTPTYTETNTPTYSPTNSPTYTETQTSTNTPTNTPTHTPSYTETNTVTLTLTETPTQTATNSPTNTPTYTATNTPTYTPTNTETLTETNTATYTPTYTATETATNTPTYTETKTATETATDTATYSQTETATNTPTYTATNSPTETATSTETYTETRTATETATNTETQTATETQSATRTATYTRTSTISGTSTKTATGTRTPSITATNTETDTATETPTETPTLNGTITQSSTATYTATQTATQVMLMGHEVMTDSDYSDNSKILWIDVLPPTTVALSATLGYELQVWGNMRNGSPICLTASKGVLSDDTFRVYLYRACMGYILTGPYDIYWIVASPPISGRQ